MKGNVYLKRMLIWIILSESMLILSTRMGAFLHEFVGHGLMAEMLGGRFETFTLTLFSGGEAIFNGDWGKTASFIISLGGIGINLITGVAALILLKEYRFSFTSILFGLFLAGVSLLSQIQYLILGAYYRYGDPACLGESPAAAFFSWAGGLVALAFFSWYLMRLFFRFQDANFPEQGLIRRAAITLVILGIPILIYAALYHCGRTSLGSMAAIEQARIHAQKEAERIKAEKGAVESIDEIRKGIEPYPLMRIIISIYLLTSALAFIRPAGKGSEGSFPSTLSSLIHCIPWVILSCVVLGLITFFW